MKTTASLWTKEFVWLFSILIVASAINFFITRQFVPFSGAALDLQFHDTYFVIRDWMLFINIFISLAFIIYLVKESIRRFNYIPSNLILAIIMLTLLIFSYRQHEIFSSLFQSGGWVIYPPLSAMSETEQFALTNINRSVSALHMTLIGSEIILTIGLFSIGFKVGRLSKTN